MPLLAGIGPFGAPELLIILLIVVLVFGVGRLPDVGGAVGKSIREFRKETKSEKEHTDASASPAEGGATTSAAPTRAADAIFCAECGASNARGAKFCSNCGSSISAPVG